MTDRTLRVTDLDDGSFVDVDPPVGGPPADRPSRPADPKIVALPSASGLERCEVVVDGWRFRFEVEDARRARLRDRARRAATGHGPATIQTVKAQIPGRVVNVAVAPGDVVTLGQPLLAIEAMKMENEVRAPRAGKVDAVLVVAGARVELGQALVRIV